MTSPDVPSWVDVTHGTAPILLVAPHAGRRHDLRIPGQHKVNDLLTAEVTRELAAGCGASTIVNARMDRNLLDLNRVSQVRRDAPWLIPVMAAMLERMIASAGRAIVLVIHGWNVTQAACDVGIGMREHPDGIVPVRPDSATASEAFIDSHVLPLQRAAAADGIAVTIGSRYPAAHPNNLLQIFRAVADQEADAPCPVGTLCRTSRVDAAQLELAIPLRWPGPRRDRFLALLTAMLSAGTRSSPRLSGVASRPLLRAAGGRIVARRGVQLVTGEALVMASIEVGTTGPIGGRLVVSDEPHRLALFTGEVADAAAAWTVPPLSFEAADDGALRVRYDGPLVDFASLTPFLDLEQGLATGRLVEGHVDLTFVPEAPAHGAERFGAIHGRVAVDGRVHVVAAHGVGTSGIGSGTTVSHPGCRITLPTSPWGALMLVADPDVPPTWTDDGRLSGTLVGQAPADGDALRVGCTLALMEGGGRLELVHDGARFAATLERLIPVRRPGRDGAVIQTTFALVRQGERSVGWLEVSIATSPVRS